LKVSIGNFLIALILGLFIGAVAGSLVDKILNLQMLSKALLSEAIRFELYIIKIEIQLTPAALVGMVVTGYLVIRKG